MSDILDTEIKFLSGVGPKRSELLSKELGINTFRDLLYYFPYKYIDRTKFHKISGLDTGMPYIQLRGIIKKFQIEGGGRNKRLTAVFSDDTGSVKLVWFKGIKWIRESYMLNREYIIFGRPGLFNESINIVHPEIEDPAKPENKISSAIQSQYSTTEKLKNNYITSKTISKLLGNLFNQLRIRIKDSLPAWMRDKYKLMDLHDALFITHFPNDNNDLQNARLRLKLEELFYIQLSLLSLKIKRGEKFRGHIFGLVGRNFNDFYANNLPFRLTSAQKRVMKEIRRDLGSGKQMNRLLQGDVGSGKTVIALMSMLLSVDNGFQACIMAPTEILSNQHYNTIASLLKGLDTGLCLLTGSTKRSERERIAEGLADGSIKIIIGTHALIEDTVNFKMLGLVIIDEQHRFGVAQRARLWKKDSHPPHILVMTATPIPRTLAMTLYGDLDVSVIDELPPGRKPVKTLHFTDSARLRVFGFMKEQIKKGRQIYIVFPLIRESEKMDYKDLEDGVESITRAFTPPLFTVSVVHGKMRPADKEISMKLFTSGQADILIATTVIEVGVDVPNASVMIIESAERFGLSQLHQLRGRVGRGAKQSYCVLMSSDKLSNEARKRIDIMVRTNDGFEIAEADLQLRGPGDLEGTQQSGIGFDLKIASLGRDGQILEYARRIAEEILEDDPLLQKSNNFLLKQQLNILKKPEYDWSKIS